MAADLAVVALRKEGLAAARYLAEGSIQLNGIEAAVRLPAGRQPLLMVSMSAGEDPHFRKAWFDATQCPVDCPRPCERLCPAAAIDRTGVVRDRCYGCGRCLPVCPLGFIEARSHPTSLDAIARQVLTQVNALEIHTQVGHFWAFADLWETIKPWVGHLQLISISCPDGDGYLDYLKRLRDTMALDPSQTLLMWQTDGRPMSGDIGKGTTHAAIKLAQKVLSSDLAEPVQLAGGTNQHTVLKLRELGLWSSSSSDMACDRTVSGIAYGSFARHLLMPVIEQTHYLEEVPQALQTAVALADTLVGPLKWVPSGAPNGGPHLGG